MKQYHHCLEEVLEEGENTSDRTKTGTCSRFGLMARYDMAKGFPLVTTKKLHLRSIIHELLWFLSGDTNIAYLRENGVSIWNEWADENGDLGPVYGHQWRQFPKRSEDGEGLASVDQISDLVDLIKTDPDSRRMLVTAWNPGDLPRMKLPPCHALWQVKVLNGRIHLLLYQRSADMFLGVPFNIASYALLLHMLAHVTGLEPGDFIHMMGDAHIYSNHLEQVKKQLARTPRRLPTLKINRKVESIFDFRYEDFTFEGYDPYPHIAAPVAV